MIKKILYWMMIVVIVGGGVYSYKQVDFGRKTAMLFQMMFGGANSMAGPGGGPQGGGRGPGGEQGQPPRQSGDSGSGGIQGGPQVPGSAANQGRGFQPGGDSSGRPPQGMGKGGGPGGGIISVRNVIPYAFIFSFFVMVACIIEKSLKRFQLKKGSMPCK
jgi:hypothetical protein